MPTTLRKLTPSERTILFPGPAAAGTAETPFPQAVQAVRRQWLIQIEGPFWQCGRVLELSRLRREVALGSARSCAIRIEDPSVSPIQAMFMRKPRRGVYLRCLPSGVPVFLNGEPMDGEKLLMDGDRIQVGSTVVFEYVDARRPRGHRLRRWARRAISLLQE